MSVGHGNNAATLTERSRLLPRTDEERQPEEMKETPIPWGQFSITLVLQLAEPMSSQVIYPFVPQLIRETGVTKGDDKKVAYYVGIMESIFFATQALTVLHWSRISDCVGRKPVILTGLAGLAISMFCFGLVRSFPALVIARSLNGALNGNIGVIKSMMGELTDSTNVARAFAYQPISWSTGATIGPLIGGSLSHPTERIPGIFGGNQFLERYPYFLPCLIPACFTVVAWLVTLTLLKETNPTGFTFRKLLSRLRPRFLSRHSPVSVKQGSSISSAPPLRTLLTGPVVLSTSAYALVSLLDITYRAIQPTFYASPRSLGGLGLPPHVIGIFLAFFGLANGVFQAVLFARLTKRWGNKRVYLMGVASAAPIFALFPLISAVVHAEDRAQAKNRGMEIEGELSAALIALVTLQLTLTLLLNMCYGSVFIYITAAASVISLKSVNYSNQTNKVDPLYRYIVHPTISSSSSSATLVSASRNHCIKSRTSSKPCTVPKSIGKMRGRGGKKTLGAVNGLAQCTVSIMRCVGPYMASSLYAKGLAWEYGSDAGHDMPNDGGPVMDPLPEGAGVASISPIDDVLRNTMLVGDIGKKMTARTRLAGLTVYLVLIVLVILTLVVGSRLPDVPWSAAEEEEDDDDDEGSSQEQEERHLVVP